MSVLLKSQLFCAGEQQLCTLHRRQQKLSWFVIQKSTPFKILNRRVVPTPTQKSYINLLQMGAAERTAYKQLLLDSLPMMIGNSMQIFIMTINLHYSTSNVMTAGLGLSMILIHSLGGSLLYGFNNGYCNFACRAFGAKNQQKFDSYLAQGLFNLGVLLVLLTVMGMLSYRLSIVTGQEEMVAREAYRFYMWQLPGLWCFFLADFLRSYLNAQEIFKELLYANVASCLIHLILSSIFSARYGFYGIILSTNLTFLSLLLIILTLIHLHSPSPFPLKTLLHSQWHSNYLPFLKQCSYIAMPYFLDLFMFQLMALFVGSYQHLQQTTAHIAFTNPVMINGAIISGYAYTVMAKASHLIGMNDAGGVRRVVRRGIVVALVTIQGLYVSLLVFHERIFAFYTDDRRVVELMRTLLGPYFVYCFFDALMFIGGNTYKALRMGKWITTVFFVSYYGVGGSTLILLAVTIESKLWAAWIGFTAGSIAITVLMWLKSRQIDLEELTERLHMEVKNQEDREMALLTN